MLAALAMSAALVACQPASEPASMPQAFQSGSWTSWQTEHRGQPRITHLWGLSCAPCIEELPRWVQFAAAHPQTPIMLVQIEPLPAGVEDYIALLNRAGGLGHIDHRYFTGEDDERMRYEIDPDWAGETPRTLQIAADGSVQAHSGPTNFNMLGQWLDTQR